MKSLPDHCGERFTDDQRHRQFLAQFPNQCGGVRLAGFHLAAGKFPASAQTPAHGPPSDTFDNGGVNASILGNVITLTWAGTSSPNDFRAVYNIQTTGVPDSGSSLAMFGIGLFGLFRVKRFLRSNP